MTVRRTEAGLAVAVGLESTFELLRPARPVIQADARGTLLVHVLKMGQGSQHAGELLRSRERT